jgi:hypothetical protein
MAAGVESSTGKTADWRLMCNFLLSGVFMPSESEYEEYERERQRQEQHDAMMDREDACALLLKSPETGSELSIVSQLDIGNMQTELIVANASERWKVFVRFEKSSR